MQDGIDTLFKGYLARISSEYRFDIDSMEVMPDHVHLLISCSPQFYIPDMIKIMKGNSARWLFMEHPEVKGCLLDGHLWGPSYCVVTASDRSWAQIQEYLSRQKIK